MTEITQYRDKIGALDFRLDLRRQWINDLVAINDARPRGKLLLIWSLQTTQITPPGAMAQQGGEAPRGLARGAMMAQGSDKWGSTGFEGIRPAQTMASRLVDPVTAAFNAPDPRNYNGMIIMGYAQDIPAMEEFIDNLKASGRFLPEGVYFDERFADPVPFTTVDNAGGSSSGPSITGGGSSNDEGGRGRGSRGGGLTGGGGRMGRLRATTPGAAPNVGWNTAGSIVAFRVDVQYVGDIIEPPKELAEGAGGNARPARASRGSNRRDRDS